MEEEQSEEEGRRRRREEAEKEDVSARAPVSPSRVVPCYAPEKQRAWRNRSCDRIRRASKRNETLTTRCNLPIDLNTYIVFSTSYGKDQVPY